MLINDVAILMSGGSDRTDTIIQASNAEMTEIIENFILLGDVVEIKRFVEAIGNVISITGDTPEWWHLLAEYH